VVGEVLKLAPSFARGVRACGLELLHIDVEAGDGTPEVLPPGGQHAGLHHLPGLHEGHDVVDEAIRQGAQPVAAGQAAAACTGPLSFRADLHGVSCLEHFLCRRPKLKAHAKHKFTLQKKKVKAFFEIQGITGAFRTTQFVLHRKTQNILVRFER